MRPWLEMSITAIAKVGVEMNATPEQLARAFEAHTAAVRATIPASQLLVYQAKEGWAPLCEFLGVPVPATEYPRSNGREEFWEKVKGPQA